MKGADEFATYDAALAVLRERERRASTELEEFRAASGGFQRVVIFGCGQLGEVALAGARAAGLEPVAFADNNSKNWALRLGGLPVLSPPEAVAEYSTHSFFLVAVYNPSAPVSQLKALGCKYVVPYALFVWMATDSMPHESRVWRPHRIATHLATITAAWDSMSDPASRAEFAAQLAWRATLDPGWLPAPSPASEMYFDSTIMTLSPDECLVDCGAYDGDSLRAFLLAAHGHFARVYAFEPDVANLAALARYVDGLTPGDKERITIFPFGLSDRDARLSFDAAGGVGSRLSETETMTSIDCRRLDTVMALTAPTIIKMDIEGAELPALRGAAETIRRARPILAICAYHSCDDLWLLPLLMRELLPDCRLFLRRYAEDCWETVYYAVPPERATERAG